jgi:hypothetical protein
MFSLNFRRCKVKQTDVKKYFQVLRRSSLGTIKEYDYTFIHLLHRKDLLMARLSGIHYVKNSLSNSYLDWRARWTNLKVRCNFMPRERSSCGFCSDFQLVFSVQQQATSRKPWPSIQVKLRHNLI